MENRIFLRNIESVYFLTFNTKAKLRMQSTHFNGIKIELVKIIKVGFETSLDACLSHQRRMHLWDCWRVGSIRNNEFMIPEKCCNMLQETSQCFMFPPTIFSLEILFMVVIEFFIINKVFPENWKKDFCQSRVKDACWWCDGQYPGPFIDRSNVNIFCNYWGCVKMKSERRMLRNCTSLHFETCKRKDADIKNQKIAKIVDFDYFLCVFD